MASDDGLLVSLVVGIVVLVLMLILFELFRRLFPRIFKLRENLASYPDDIVTSSGKRIWYPPYPLSGYPLSWIKATWQVKEVEIAKHISVDAVVYLRYLKSQLLLYTVLTVLTFITLMPVYATGTNKNLEVSDPRYIQGVLVLSLSNVAPKDNRLWVTWIVEIFVMIIVYTFYYKDFQRYTFYAQKYLASRAPRAFAVIVYDIPERFRSSDAVFAIFDRIFPGEVASANFVQLAPKLLKKKMAYTAALTKKELAIWKTENSKTHEVPQIKPKAEGGGPCAGKLEPMNAIEYWHGKELELREEVRSDQERCESVAPTALKDVVSPRSEEVQEQNDLMIPTRVAIVLFKTMHTASQAAQTQIWYEPGEFIVKRAPEPAAINWPKLKVSRKLDLPVKMIVSFVIILICVFWGAISVAISALGNLSALSQVNGFSWLEPVLSWPNWLVGLIEGFLPPLLLMVLSKLAPVIFRVLLIQCRYPWLISVEIAVRNYYYFFLFLTSFVFILVSGSILSQLQTLIDNPTATLDILASSIPAQALFFMNLVLQSSFIGFPLLHSQLPRVFLRLLLWLFTWPKTERQLRKLDLGPGHFFLYFKFYALSMLTSLIAIVYSSITPLINLFAAVYFLIAYWVCKYAIAYTHHVPYRAGGLMYRGCFWGLMINLFFKQLCMIGLFSVFKAPAQAALEAIFLLSSIFLAILVHRRFSRLSSQGALMSVFDSYGATIGKEDEIAPRFLDAYTYPGLVPIKDPQNLSGVSDEQIAELGLERFMLPRATDVEDQHDAMAKAQ
eukprot:CAMPEP_0185844576 /NCGR_PEP_ID=MMETSP1354-20130828/681_1 /TAXON_ID=708628 /ORGANISM="Erythrolobus madagascarensis, Strain CCMP3276" /LENGTH=782 /DNA_ID=CAMNT_0028544259 /DNA_START=49 /DNA_END=2397 /DNA_ORIENTATION=+